MKRRRFGRILGTVLAALVAGAGGGVSAARGEASERGADAESAAALDFFERRVRPVLVERCHECHSAASARPKGKLRLDTREGALAGGASGEPAVVAGDPDASALIRAIRYLDEDLQMPPDEPLPPEVVADFEKWIRDGAVDPRDEESSPAALPPDASATEASDHWAFRPPVEPPLPAVRDEAWVRTPIDRFVLAALEASGLSPSPEADRRTLIRRATFDLIGLPPTPEETEAFVADAAPDAYEKLIDRLLASPRYGERWARRWLDVARYADTKGYVYGDREERRQVHAFTYRDWVADAMNRDVPYDRFLMLQFAADRLVAAGEAERADLAAMRFLTGGPRFLGVVHDIVDDRIDVATRGPMGLTVACARCHDHKFDPIPTEDYYSLYGIFANSSERIARLDGDAPPPDAELPDDRRAFEEELARREAALRETFAARAEAVAARVRERFPDYMVALADVASLPNELFYEIRNADDLNPTIVRRIQAYAMARGADDAVWGPWNRFAALPADRFAALAEPTRLESLAIAGLNPRVAAILDRPPESLAEFARRYGELFAGVRAERARSRLAKAFASDRSVAPDPVADPLLAVLDGADSPTRVPAGAVVDVEWYFDEPTRVELAKLQKAIDAHIVDSPAAPRFAVVLEDKPERRDARVFRRGNPANKGEEVPPRFLQVLSAPDRPEFRDGSGRLELARAIVDPANPLTARTIVNRVWAWKFGQGIVRTPSDFGTRCEPPSHPELLDWLAVRFVADGWSLKRLHREIMLSSVWRQGSIPLAAPPSAEGEIAEIGAAERVDPDNRLLWKFPRARLDFEAARDALLAVSGELDAAIGGPPFDLAANPAVPRRTLYGYVDRQYLPGMMRVFDFPNPDLHSPGRARTTIPQQTLFFLNGDFVRERARAFAARTEREAGDDPRAKIERMTRLAFQRAPSAREMELGMRFVAESPPVPEAPPPPPDTGWRYGYGEYDPASDRVKSFEPLPHFTGEAWQGGEAYPDPALGWVQLTAEGGHPGNDMAHAAIRRWESPIDGTVRIGGAIEALSQPGNGIRARIVSSRSGKLGQWEPHDETVEATAEAVEVRAGDTIDFIVDHRDDLNSDEFLWAPTIAVLDQEMAGAETKAGVETNAGSEAESKSDSEPRDSADGETAPAPPREWDARRDFSGPKEALPPPMTAWEKYAQALLMANEFVFVD